ncbi:bifunctional enoyl-CoA hydratase/phosphate acetyltransferase [Salinisphaera orenii]|uniref:bifunctional enoyl-CoA hydratase/phosphate acetyltransferase n=1 Tax=Salinisphaera orenii TaxID=856731 RepID=UPI00296E6346
MFSQRFVFETPQTLLDRLDNRSVPRVVIAGADHELPMSAAADAARRGLIQPILVGPAHNIRQTADDIGWDMADAELIPTSSENVVSESVRLILAGAGDIMAKGHIDTSQLMSAVLDRERGLRTKSRLTHAFHMTAPTWSRPLTVSDAALNIAPDLETKRHITRNAVAVAQATGCQRPRIALLSGSEKPSERMPSSMEAEQLARELNDDTSADCEVAGPLAMDLAISPEAGQAKGIDGSVIGRADVVIVPNLEAGNILYKTLVYASGATAAGLVVGARVPIVLTSRADPASARLTSFALAALMANGG